MLDTLAFKATLIIFFGPRFLRQAENVPDEKKKLTFECFLYFFLRHDQKCRIFFTKSVVFSPKNGQNLQKMSDMSDLWNFYFYFFPPTWLKNPCRDSWTKEYSECCLTNNKWKWIWSEIHPHGDLHNRSIPFSFFHQFHLRILYSATVSSSWSNSSRPITAIRKNTAPRNWNKYLADVVCYSVK